YMPSQAAIGVLNPDGSPRIQRIIGPDGQSTFVQTTMTIPIDRLVSLGGDTKLLANVEYRIPLVGPLTLALFSDIGLDRATFRNQLQINPGRVELLNAQFPGAALPGKIVIEPGTQGLRWSTGVELQYFIRQIHAPVRFYWAYNPLVNSTILMPPFAPERAYF